MFLVFVNSLFIGYSGAVMPGSMLTYTINKSLKSGAKTGLFVSLGHAFLEMFLVLFIFLGAGTFMSGRLFQTIVGILGGIILVYLGSSMIWEVWKKKNVFQITKMNEEKQGNTFLAGIILSITNPYFLIWWAVVGLSLILEAHRTFGVIGIILFYFGHILSDISWFSFISFLVSKTRNLLNQKIYNVITVCLGLFLVIFGIKFMLGI